MSKRMAAKAVTRQQDDVAEQYEAADPGTELSVPVEGNNGVIPQERQHDRGGVEEVSVQVLQDKRETRLAAILVTPQVSYRASRWIQEICAVICFPIVVAGGC